MLLINFRLFYCFVGPVRRLFTHFFQFEIRICIEIKTRPKALRAISQFDAKTDDYLIPMAKRFLCFAYCAVFVYVSAEAEPIVCICVTRTAGCSGGGKKEKTPLNQATRLHAVAISKCNDQQSRVLMRWRNQHRWPQLNGHQVVAVRNAKINCVSRGNMILDSNASEC